MRVIRVHEHGDSDVLTCEEVPRPDPDEDELLVEVRAAGVNPVDWLVREGYADDALDLSLPFVPGWDLSGVVAAVGDGVRAFDAGDEVFGTVGMPGPGGTYAEYAAVSAADVVETPDALDHVEAAALPMVALTARRALFEEAGLAADDRVLIHAGAGGVGHVAVQLADRVGAHVVCTASGRNEAFCRDLGADEFVNYREQRFETAVGEVDVVLDAVGGETLSRSVEVLAEGGRLVTLPEPPGDDVIARTRDERDASVHWFSVEPDAAALADLRDSVEAGGLRPTVSDTFPLSEAATAQEVSQEGHVRGKLVLDVAADSSGGDAS